MVRWRRGRRGGGRSTGSASTVRSRTLLTSLGILVQGVVRFLYTVLVARSTSPAVLGAVNASISLAMFLSLLWPSAMGAGVVRFVAGEQGAGRHEASAAVLRLLARQALWSSVVLSVASAAIAALVLDLPHGTAIGTAGLVLAYSCYSFVRGVQYARDTVARATRWEVIAGGLALVLLVAVLATGSSAVLLAPLTVGYALYAFVLWPRGPAGPTGPDLRRDVARFVLLTVVGTVASTGFLQLSMVVARATTTGPDAGYYAAALALATPASLLARSLSLALYPTMAQTQGRGDPTTVRWMTDAATRSLVVVMVAVFGFLVLTSEVLVSLVYGSRFSPAADLLPLLMLAVLPTSVAVAAVSRLSSASNRLYVSVTTSSVVGLLLGLAVWALVTDRYGVLGIAIGYLAGGVVVGLGPLVITWWVDRYRWGGLVARALVGVSAIAALRVWESEAGFGGWVQVAVAGGFVVVWLLMSWRDAATVVRYGLLRQPATPE